MTAEEYGHDRHFSYEAWAQAALGNVTKADPEDPEYGLKHGRANTYRRHGCRCSLCRGAINEVTRASRERNYARSKSPDDPRHGKSSFYINHGCRCVACTEAARLNVQRQVENRKNRDD